MPHYSDDRIRDLVEAVQHSKLAGKTTLFVCSDHGFQPVRHDIHPNVLLRKLGLLEVQDGKPAKQAAWCLSQGGASAVYVLDQDRREQILKQLQEGLAGIEGVEAVLDARQFTKLGQPTPGQDPRGADLWLAAKCGYSFDNAVKGEEVVTHLKTTVGTHGHLPDQPALLATCVVWGAGVKPGTDLGKVSNLSIAPTIARLLGIELPTADGKPLEKLIEEKRAVPSCHLARSLALGDNPCTFLKSARPTRNRRLWQLQFCRWLRHNAKRKSRSCVTTCAIIPWC